MGNSVESLADADSIFEELVEPVGADLPFEEDLPSFADIIAVPESRSQLTSAVATGIASVKPTQTLETIGVASLSIVKLFGLAESSDESSDEEPPVYLRRPKLTHSKSCPAILQRKESR